MTSTGAPSSNELQWLDLNTGHQTSSLSNGGKNDMPYWEPENNLTASCSHSWCLTGYGKCDAISEMIPTICLLPPAKYSHQPGPRVTRPMADPNHKCQQGQDLFGSYNFKRSLLAGLWRWISVEHAMGAGAILQPTGGDSQRTEEAGPEIWPMV